MVNEQRGHSTFALLDEFHWHVAQLGKSPTQSQQRPPIVKIDLHGSPHRDPSANRKALPRDGSPRSRLLRQQKPTEEQAGSKEYQPDDKAGATLFEEAIELQVGDFSAVSKMVVDGRSDQFFGVVGRPLVQMDTQFDGCVLGKFLGPAYDEFFRVVVKILFNERRRVHRIEKLICVAQLQANGVRVPPVCCDKV